MLDIIVNCISACASIFSLCKECGLPGKASYTCSLKDNLLDLQEAFERLTEAKNKVMNRVRVAEEGPMQHPFNVELWLKDVEKVAAKFADVQNVESQETQRLCLGGCCSTNLMKTYAFGKRVAKLLHEVNELNRQAEDFERVVEPKPDATTSKSQAAGDLKHEATPSKAAGAKASVDIHIGRAQNISLDRAVLNNNKISIVQH